MVEHDEILEDDVESDLDDQVSTTCSPNLMPCNTPSTSTTTNSLGGVKTISSISMEDSIISPLQSLNIPPSDIGSTLSPIKSCAKRRRNVPLLDSSDEENDDFTNKRKVKRRCAGLCKLTVNLFDIAAHNALNAFQSHAIFIIPGMYFSPNIFIIEDAFG